MDVRHASCVGARACVHALRGFVYAPSAAYRPAPLRCSIKHYLQNNKTTQSFETKQGFWASVKREHKNNRKWPVPLDPIKAEGGIVVMG